MRPDRTRPANYSGATRATAARTAAGRLAVLLVTAALAASATAPAAARAQDAGPDATAKSGGWRLAGSASPYLRAHADDPVAWYPWGAEAFARAKDLSRPVFLSIGYSTCHWCHRMQRDTFRDPDCVRLLDENFVCIKVDREQRPDVDARYQQALELIAHTGGWPASLFLTPDGAPFAGATYLPPRDGPESRGLLSLGGEIARLWKDERAEVLREAGELQEWLAKDLSPEAGPWDAARVLGDATTALAGSLDSERGGLRGPSRFPPSLLLQFLMRQHLRTGVEVMGLLRTTLDALEGGALRDHVGGGFHRYCIDDRWELPHFEKTLYDNALLAQTFAEAAALTGEQRPADIARETLRWLAAELRTPDGLYAAALDADSLPWGEDGRPLPDAHAEEGLFYLWSPGELEAALGPEDGRAFAQLFGVTEAGNVGSGRSIPRPMRTLAVLAADPGPGLPTGAAFEAWLAGCRERLAAARAARPAPARDDKCLAAWNGLALTAFARSASLLADGPTLTASSRLAAAIDTLLVLEEDPGDGPIRRVRVPHQWYDGQATGEGDLSDYACVGRGLLDAYEAADAPSLLVTAVRTCRSMLERFEDRERGGFFETAGADPLLPGRGREFRDGVTPSGGSVAIELLLRLAPLDDSGTFAASARRAIDRLAPLASRLPAALPALLTDIDLQLGPLAEIVVDGRGEAHAALLEAARRTLLPGALLVPNATSAAATCKELFGGVPSLLEARRVPFGTDRAWVCVQGACAAPADTPDELRQRLAEAAPR